MKGPSIHPRLVWNASSSGNAEGEAATSISAMLDKARAEGRAARFWLTTVPLTAGFILTIASQAAYFAGVPFTAAWAFLSTVPILFSVLPSDKRAVYVLHGVWTTVFLVYVFIQGIYATLTFASVSASSKCYADKVVLVLDEEQRVHCGWVVVTGIRYLTASIFTAIVTVQFVKLRLTAKGSGPLLAKMIWCKWCWASTPPCTLRIFTPPCSQGLAHITSASPVLRPWESSQ